MYDNLDAYKAGEHIPHIISKPFMEHSLLVLVVQG